MFLLAAAALASPLDDAAQTGRPVVVLIERREDDHRAAVWLRHATGDARSRIDAVTLVLATPEELAAWTGHAVEADVDLVRLDPVHHQQIGAKRVVLPGSEEASSAASGVVLGAGVFPGELPRDLPNAQLTQDQLWQAIGGTVSAWDAALTPTRPDDVPLSPGRPTPPPAAWEDALAASLLDPLDESAIDDATWYCRRLILGLRFNRLMQGTRLAAVYQADPDAFVRRFKAYIDAVPATARFPWEEARLWEGWAGA